MAFPALAMIPAAYFCGSIPTGLLIGRAKGIDIRQHGSKNIGATNVGRVLGKPWFFICFSIDFLKSLLPTLIAGHLLGTLGSWNPDASSAWTWLAVMVAAVLGNVLNPWLKFKGGKGVATSIGAIMGVFPPLAVPGLIIFVIWLGTLKVSRYISVSSIVAGLCLPVATLISFVIAKHTGRTASLDGAWPFLAVAALLAALVTWTHRANIARLRAGTEPKVGQRVKV
jgi:acyl phosphate:glycerol-3-phosphate acyltransferase